jgi:RNA recognition motif-containing protein
LCVFVLLPSLRRRTDLLDGPSNPAHFRLFIGDLDPAIGDEAFCAAFSGVRYPSFVKGRVIRDKYTNKGKGYGFVSYSDPEDFLKAWKEMNGTSWLASLPLFHTRDWRALTAQTGKYVGTRPVTIKKAQAGVKAVSIGARKARELESKMPAKSGTTPYERANAEEAGHKAVAGEKGYGPQRSRKQYIRRWAGSAVLVWWRVSCVSFILCFP